jgi:hypothetical protein
MISIHHTNDTSSNNELREQVVHQVMIKEELLKKEEEKLREMEEKVQRGKDVSFFTAITCFEFPQFGPQWLSLC